MMKRNSVKVEYTWDLSHLYKSEDEYNDDFAKVKEIGKKLEGFHGKLNNKKNILEEFKLSSKLSRIVDRMQIYISLKKERNGTDVVALEQIEEFSNWATDFDQKTAYISVELSKLDDKFIDELIKDKDFSNFTISLKDLKEYKKHILDQKSEEMLSQIYSFTNFSEIFSKLDDIELKFGEIKLDDGKVVQVTNDNYGLFMHNGSQRVRKDVFTVLHDGFKGFNLTISENFINFLKSQNVFAKLRNFESAIDSAMFSSKVDKKVLDQVISEVNKHLVDFYKYQKTLKKVLDLKTFYNSDVYAPVNTTKHKLYEYEQAKVLVKNALCVLGEEYNQKLQILLDNRTIDVYPTENKGGGGFSTSCYDVHPYILLNYNGTYNDVSTLAHELGHSMHSVMSNLHQVYEKAGYKIFVAEIASTVNEILLFSYMEKHTKNNNERLEFIASFLSNFYATVFRQTMFSEFELYAHTLVNKNQVVSYDKLNTYYGELQKKYFGDGVKMLDNAKYEWSRIPHFYRPFYVFKYATGFISACSIVQNILTKGQDYVDNYYMKFLSAGASADPVDILKLAGVDICDSKTYDSAFALFNHYIDEFSLIGGNK